MIRKAMSKPITLGIAGGTGAGKVSKIRLKIYGFRLDETRMMYPYV